MNAQVYLIRWHIARWMIHTGLLIAPPGGARKSLIKWLTAWGEMVQEAVRRDA